MLTTSARNEEKINNLPKQEKICVNGKGTERQGQIGKYYWVERTGCGSWERSKKGKNGRFHRF